MEKTICTGALLFSLLTTVTGINYYRKVIKTGEDIELSCVSDHPVHWCYPPIYETSDIQSLPQESFYRSAVKSDFSKGLNYKTEIKIKRASYEYTGYYHCIRNDTELPCNRVMESTESSTYVYVEDPSNLMVVKTNVAMKVYQNENAVLPCLPTSPHVNVQLKKDEEVLISGKQLNSETTVTFDRTVGFTLQPFTVSQSGSYTCVATWGRLTEELAFNVMAELTDKPTYLIQPTIKRGLKIVTLKEVVYVKEGDELTFDCYSLQKTSNFNITWNFPYNSGISLGLDNCTKPRPTCKRGTLTVHNVTYSNAGSYTCAVNSPSLKRVKSSFEVHVVNSGRNLESLYVRTCLIITVFLYLCPGIPH